MFDYEAELSACAAGDKAAFMALYDHESVAMYSLARAMLGEPAATQVLQETFVLIWRNAAGYSPALGTARAWMYSILRYRALERLKRAQASGGLPAERDPLPALSWQPGVVANVLAGLPVPQLEALLHAYLHGGDYARIGSLLDRSEPDVRASIDRVLQQVDEAVHA